MEKHKGCINYFFKIILSTLIFITVLGAQEDERVQKQLSMPIPAIPLKNAMGEEAFDDAIGSGKYRFVGNSKCRLCHRKFFIGRKNDPHDHAMETLVASGHDKDSHCLACHSTGYGIKTGFVDMQTTPRLSNVQCEGCHGPGNVHIQKATLMLRDKSSAYQGGGFLAGKDNPQILKKMCTSCHTKDWNKSYHDLDKAYDSYKQASPNSRSN